jgi:hypothetical protein
MADLHSPLYTFYQSVYPGLGHTIQSCTPLPLSARSLIIKACQAQSWPDIDEQSTLRDLMLKHPPVILRRHFGLHTMPLINLAGFLQWDIADPLLSAILLDVMRALPLSSEETKLAREASWNKEMVLVFGKSQPTQIRWELFFDSDPNTLLDQIHPLLPGNARHMSKIRSTLHYFRRKYQKRRHTLYARATHKNMSFGTRRDYEYREHTTLEGVGIFGQDDWQRYYARTGVKLEGGCEMRQKWYPSGAKPRTYFAQGGISYNDSRFLQNFFTDLANVFTPTNHDYRLRPERLRGLYGQTGDFFIYDLSNFTSNMNEQKYFVEHLSEFFKGVEVDVLDEEKGFVTHDLGDLLSAYCDTCVFGPLLSLEREPNHRNDHTLYPHGIASLLGIFGNLMTCTVAHYLIISPTTEGTESQNIAGDDGAKDEDAANNFESRTAISLVGCYAPDKCFKGSDPCAICLKRPLLQLYPSVTLMDNIVPPSLVTTVAYLLGQNPDSRYSFMGLESMTLHRRVSVIGKDLYRFLTSCFQKQYHDTMAIAQVYHGFTQLVKKFLLKDLKPSLTPYFWPLDPLLYEFGRDHPGLVLLCMKSEVLFQEIPVQRVQPCIEEELRNPGDAHWCNSDGRLKLLETLGYVTKEKLTFIGDLETAWLYWMGRLKLLRARVPDVYEYTVRAPIPHRFVR